MKIQSSLKHISKTIYNSTQKFMIKVIQTKKSQDNIINPTNMIINNPRNQLKYKIHLIMAFKKEQRLIEIHMRTNLLVERENMIMKKMIDQYK